nr:MAG TPA: hypothetical protein [Caudoviricetes sp.]
MVDDLDLFLNHRHTPCEIVVFTNLTSQFVHLGFHDGLRLIVGDQDTDQGNSTRNECNNNSFHWAVPPLLSVHFPTGRVSVRTPYITVNGGDVQSVVVAYNIAGVVSVMLSGRLRPYRITFLGQTNRSEESGSNIGSPISLRSVSLCHLVKLRIADLVFTVGQILTLGVRNTYRPRTVQMDTHQSRFLGQSSTGIVHSFTDNHCLFDYIHTFTPTIPRASFISIRILAPSLTSSVLPVTSQSAMFASMSSRRPSRSGRTKVYSSYSNMEIS